MGDRNVVGSSGTGSLGSVGTVSHVDANSFETPTYNQPRVIGENTVYLTADDSKIFDSWNKSDVSVHDNTKRSMADQLRATIKMAKDWLTER